MKKKLYYTVEKELQQNNDVEETTGNKTITMYSIDDNTPIVFGTIDCQNSDTTKDVIQEYLNDNGYGDEDFKFILL